VLAKNGREEAAAATRELQDALDAGLQSGSASSMELPRDIVVRAVVLWQEAATLLEGWCASDDGDAAAASEASRLRIRISSLQEALASGSSEQDPC
jgi:hypothetical protein